MPQCDKDCRMYDKEYDNKSQTDAIIIEQRQCHYCPYWDGEIPEDVFTDCRKCDCYTPKERH